MVEISANLVTLLAAFVAGRDIEKRIEREKQTSPKCQLAAVEELHSKIKFPKRIAWLPS
jgi:hypothetical protein